MITGTEKTEKLANESSMLIASAEASKISNDPRYKEKFRLAAMKELEVIKVYQEIQSNKYIPHMLSAGWCAVHCEDPVLASTILVDIIALDNLSAFFKKERDTLRKSLEKARKRERK
jgi:hypothetical protein